MSTRCFAMFLEGRNFVNPLCPSHRRFSASRDNFELNHADENFVFATPITTEACATSMCNDDVKCFKEVIVKEIRVY